jgi:two-component system nitrate/nitrite response regulator NarL
MAPFRVPPSKNSIRVSLVEGHILARKHLESILSRKPGCCVTEIDSQELRISRRPIPDVFVLSHFHASLLPKFVQFIRRANKNTRILVIGPPLRPSMMLSLLRSGVQGFLSDEEVDVDLRLAIQNVVEGRVWIRSAHLTSETKRYLSVEKETFSEAGHFTAQQVRVIGLVREHLSNKQIAAELGISERTVKFHLRNVFLSLGINSRYAIPDLRLGVALSESTV